MSILPGIAVKACLFGGAIGIGLLACGPAEAATTSCSAISTAGVAFSPYDSISMAAVPSIGTITFTCTGTGSGTLNLVLYGGNNGACSPRVMRSGTNPLRYDIFRDSARTQVWCGGQQRHSVVMDYSSGRTQTRSITLYGLVRPGQAPRFGDYADSLTIDIRQGGAVLQTAAVPIRGSVAAACQIAAGTLAFGTYVAGAAKDATAALTINCTSAAPYRVGLGAGQNSAGATRRLAGPNGSFVGYDLYSNATRTARWGDDSAIGVKVNGTGTGAARAVTVYGRIPAGQAPVPGSYSDQVFVTIDY